jgi:predicted amidohydrolase YtcJ
MSTIYNAVSRSFLLVFILVLLGCAGKSDITIIHNVNGYTLTSENGYLTRDASVVSFGAMAMRDGKVLATGTSEDLRGQWPDAQLIDGGGRTLLPGLIDAHAHVMGLGDAILNVNVMGLTSLDATLDAVRAYGEKYPELGWIRGRGWNQVLWPENRFPTASELDRAEAERPVWLTRVDGHAGWANSAALALAGITRDTPDPDGGQIIRDASGEPTGVLIDRAMYMVSRHIPAPDRAEQRLALEASLAEMRAVGLTGVHDAGTGIEAFALMKEAADQGLLTTRIYGMISGAGDVFDALSAEGPVVGYADDRLFLRSVKIYSDGALGSRGAALLEDYSDDPGNRGLLFNTEDEFADMIRKVASKGFQAGVHAIGDRGNRTILNAFERVNAELGEQGLRHRIEHSQVVSVADIPRFVSLGVIPSMQPTHATSDMNMAEDRVGIYRILGAYAWRTFVDQGSIIAGGSDFPVELSNPFHGLYSSVSRQDHAGRPEGGWYAAQRLTRAEALHGFTLGAAWGGHMEELVGSLEPGKWADFILVDRDYFTVPHEEIWQIQVEETWLAGQRVH